MHFSPFATVDDWSSRQKPQATGAMFPTSLALPTHSIQQPPPTPTTLQGEAIASTPRNSQSFLEGSFQDDFLPYQPFQQFDDLAMNPLHQSDNKAPSHPSNSPQIHQQQQMNHHQAQQQQHQQTVQNSSWTDQRYTQAYMSVTAAGSPMSMGQPSYYAQQQPQQPPTVHHLNHHHHHHMQPQPQQQSPQTQPQQQHYHPHQQHFQQQQRSLPPSQHMPYPQQHHHQMISHQQAFLNSLHPSQQQQIHRHPQYPGPALLSTQSLSPQQGAQQLQQQQQHQASSLSSPHQIGGKRKDVNDYMIEGTIAVPMKKPKKKKKKKEPEDPNAPPKPKRNTGLNKPLILSAELSILMGGEKELSRPEIVKRLWVHIKGNELQDPKDRRFILCDDKLKAIFHVDRVNSFGMNRDLSQHLTKKEESAPGTSTSTTTTSTTVNMESPTSSTMIVKQETPSDVVKMEAPSTMIKMEMPTTEEQPATTTAITTNNNANVKHSPTVTADTPDDVVTPQEGEHVHGLNNHTHLPSLVTPNHHPLASLNMPDSSSSTATSSSTPLFH